LTPSNVASALQRGPNFHVLIWMLNAYAILICHKSKEYHYFL
jgi:hypothetical protein